jgi:hypothetical protein
MPQVRTREAGTIMAQSLTQDLANGRRPAWRIVLLPTPAIKRRALVGLQIKADWGGFHETFGGFSETPESLRRSIAVNQ